MGAAVPWEKEPTQAVVPAVAAPTQAVVLAAAVAAAVPLWHGIAAADAAGACAPASALQMILPYPHLPIAATDVPMPLLLKQLAWAAAGAAPALSATAIESPRGAAARAAQPTSKLCRHTAQCPLGHLEDPSTTWARGLPKPVVVSTSVQVVSRSQTCLQRVDAHRRNSPSMVRRARRRLGHPGKMLSQSGGSG